MTQVTRKIRIEQSKSIVWNKVAAFSDVADASPYVMKSYPMNEQIQGQGAMRHCELNADGSQYAEEQIIDWKEGERYQVKMIGGTNPPPVDNLNFEIAVRAIDHQATTLSITFNYKPRWGIVGSVMDQLLIKRMLGGLLDNILMGYKVHIETGNKIQSLETMRTLVAHTT